MGVTIHFTGRLSTGADLQQFLICAERLAEQQGWRHERLSAKSDHSEAGFVTYPHDDCEPIKFEFDNRGRFSGWVKTHFAGPETHIQVTEFLRQLRPFLGKLGVRDEGEYWTTGSKETLIRHFGAINRIIREAVENNPSVRVGVHEPSGLIVDLIQ